MDFVWGWQVDLIFILFCELFSESIVWIFYTFKLKGILSLWILGWIKSQLKPKKTCVTEKKWKADGMHIFSREHSVNNFSRNGMTNNSVSVNMLVRGNGNDNDDDE